MGVKLFKKETMKTFTITLNEEQINTIATALNELPAKYANPVLNELTKQLQEQAAPQASEPLDTDLA